MVVVNGNTAPSIATSGADILVAGTAVFGVIDRKKALDTIGGNKNANKTEDELMKPNSWECAQESFEIEANSIRKALDYIDKESFEKAVNVLAKAERIATSGCGHSGIACQHFTHSMCCIELPARFIFAFSSITWC